MNFFRRAPSSDLPVLTGHLDQPRPGASFAAQLTVSGWALATTGAPVRVRIYIDGERFTEVVTGVSRPDVASHFPSIPGAESAGFETIIRRSKLPPRDTFTVVVEAFIPQNGGEAARRILGEATVTCAAHDISPVRRADYRGVWEAVSETPEQAVVAVCGTLDLAEYERSGIETANAIAHLTGLSPSDSVLEIGCGTGRIGLHLAPRCALWTGADVSSNMLRHAAAALSRFPNVRFQQLNGYDLQGIPDASFDVVYSSSVFMHLDEWDRYRYVTEMYRVLRPGGRCYYDNFNLLGDSGWEFFLANARLDPLDRPANISKSSTPQELECYARRAGFTDIFVGPNTHWIQVAAKKPY